MNNGKRLLVYLANGVQGGAVARQAANRGYTVRALVRDTRKSDSLKALGTEIAPGDLQDAASLNEAHRDVDYVVMQMPIGAPPQIASLTDNAICAMRLCGIQGVIVKMASAQPTIRTEVASFVANQIVEDKMRASGIAFSIVRPTIYLDNFLKPDTREGISRRGIIVYPVPADQRIAWTSADDAARAALSLLENNCFGNDRLISGTDPVDGGSLALAFSEALQRDVKFQSLSLDDLEREVDMVMGAGVGKRVSAKFRFLEQHPDQAERMLSLPFNPSPALRGFLPTPIRNWVAERRSMFISPGSAE
jgi:uncharacterized protein YbjT (DUF2867 family)